MGFVKYLAAKGATQLGMLASFAALVVFAATEVAIRASIVEQESQSKQMLANSNEERVAKLMETLTKVQAANESIKLEIKSIKSDYANAFQTLTDTVETTQNNAAAQSQKIDKLEVSYNTLSSFLIRNAPNAGVAGPPPYYYGYVIPPRSQYPYQYYTAPPQP